MTRLNFSLEVVSPMFLNGADTRMPEMRGASVRGQLRYWLRAIAGSATDDLRQIWDRESAVFGSTGQGSAVTVRVFPPAKPLNIKDSYMLPHKSNERERSAQKAIQPDSGNKVTLELVTRPGVKMPDDTLYTIRIWSLLGGLGKRSRRMFGAFALSGDEALQYTTPEMLVDQIKTTLTKAGCDVKTQRPNIPGFPTLHPVHSWIIVGQRAFSDPEIAVKSLFTDLLRSDRFRPKSDTFGSASPRRSSPLIAQVRRIGGNYYPVLTAFRSQPDNKIDWKHLHDFMNEASKTFNGIHVWGGW